MRKEILCAENIAVSYGEQTVLNFKRFYLYEGEKVGLVGVNGAGKTTLLEMIMKGEDIRAVPGAKLGYVRQNFSQINLQKTVLENIRNVSVQSEGVARSVLLPCFLSATPTY